MSRTYRRPVRLPYDPLATIEPSRSALARRARTHREDLWRLERDGVTLRMADRICDALGVHPIELWGDDYLAAVEADDTCGTHTGYGRHRARREPACDDCRAAEADHSRAMRAARRRAA